MLFASPSIAVYVLMVTAVFGAVVGSFVNRWAWRYLNGESVVRGRPRCTSCGHELGARDLAPVVSWLVARGRCRYCGAKVSVRYPVTELVCATAFVAITARYGLTLETVELLAFSGVLLFLSLTDIEDFVIPNGCIIAAIAVRVAYLLGAWALGAIVFGAIVYYLVSAFGIGLTLLVMVLVADRMFGRESMGGGDLKLYFVAGLYFGWQRGIFLIIVSCVIGVLVALMRSGTVGRVRRGTPLSAQVPGVESARAKSKPFPFGPSIAAACVITMLVGDPVISWYLALP